MWTRSVILGLELKTHSGVEQFSPASHIPFALVWFKGPITLGRLCQEWLTLCDSGEELAHTWPFQVSGQAVIAGLPGWKGVCHLSGWHRAPTTGLSHCSSSSVLPFLTFPLPGRSLPCGSRCWPPEFAYSFVYFGVLMGLFIYTHFNCIKMEIFLLDED